jgi:hypothetical protein
MLTERTRTETVSRKEITPAHNERGLLLRLVTKDLFWLLAENTIDLGATHWADALCHATT